MNIRMLFDLAVTWNKLTIIEEQSDHAWNEVTGFHCFSITARRNGCILKKGLMRAKRL